MVVGSSGPTESDHLLNGVGNEEHVVSHRHVIGGGGDQAGLTRLMGGIGHEQNTFGPCGRLPGWMGSSGLKNRTPSSIPSKAIDAWRRLGLVPDVGSDWLVISVM